MQHDGAFEMVVLHFKQMIERRMGMHKDRLAEWAQYGTGRRRALELSTNARQSSR